MNNITYAVSVDVNNPIIPYNVYVASVLDSNVRYLEMTLYQNGNVIALSNEAIATASLVTDNVLVNDSVNCTISNNIITVPLEDLQRHGNLDVQVTVTEGTKVLAIPFPIQVRVTPNIAENAQVDENSLGSYAEVVQEIAAARGDYPDLKDRLDGEIDRIDDDISDINTALLGKANKAAAGSAGELAALDGNGSPIRSGVSVTQSIGEGSNSRVPTTAAVKNALDGKADKLAGGAGGELVSATGGGALKRSGFTVAQNVGGGSADKVPTTAAVRNALNDAEDTTAENIDSIFQGNSAFFPQLYFEQYFTANGSNYRLIYDDRDGERHVLFDFGLLPVAKGEKGDKGDAGADGYSPTVSTTNLEAQTRVTVTDKNGAHNYYVKDGSSVTNAAVDANGDLIISIQQKPTSSVHPTIHTLEVNAGHVKGADAVVDPTLTVSGAAADAKKTGDGITDLKSALNNLDAGAIKYMAHDKIDILRFVEWENGYYVGEATGDLVSNSKFYYTDYISLSDFVTLLHVVTTSSYVIKYAVYDEDKTYIRGNSFSSATDYERDYGPEAKYIRLSVGAWGGSNTLEDYLKTISLFVIPSEDVIKNEFIGWQRRYLTWDSYIRTPSVGTTNVATTQSAISGCASIAIPCNKGDVFNVTGMPRDNSGFRPIMFLNGNNMCVYRSEQTTAFNQYEYIAPENGTIVINLLTSSQPVVYTGLKNVSDAVLKNKQAINIIETAPIDVFPSFMINAMAVRRVGELKKGYICLTCDDGAAELASYTIPMLLAKDVPCTFGLWASTSKVGAARPFNKSVILQSTAGIEALESALENGCEVAQHGPIEWTELTNEELNSFFDREATAWEQLGITVKGAICPSHCINNKVRVIAGGRFGVLRSGYRGYLSKADQQAVINGDVYAEYNYYCTGARSNEFGLSSFNTNAVALDWMKAAVDYALSQKMVNIVYWHDWDLTSDQKADLEALIDYAKAQNITFCTLSEIPYLK